jgi:phosphoribosyl 1,2-cyclic phosphate phosphodiesterase
MKFVFLGTGTSAGIPAIACECAVCTSSDPRDQRLRCGAMVTWTDRDGHERVVLIDATPDLRTQALRQKLKRCDAILFTHNHVDHTFGLDEVRRFNVVQKSPIDVLAEPHTMEHLQRVYKHIFDKNANVNDSFVATLIPRLIRPGLAIELFGVTFTPIRLLHGRLPIVGFRIEKQGPRGAGRGPSEEQKKTPSPFPLAYCTDVSAIPPESYEYLSGLNTLVIDALRHRRHPTHLTVEQALGISQGLEPVPAMTYFTHIAHDLGHAETEAQLPDNVRLAFDGLELG